MSERWVANGDLRIGTGAQEPTVLTSRKKTPDWFDYNRNTALLVRNVN